MCDKKVTEGDPENTRESGSSKQRNEREQGKGSHVGICRQTNVQLQNKAVT